MRGISFERFSRNQQEIEGSVEGKRRKEKAVKKEASAKQKGPQTLRSKEAIEEITEGLVSGAPKAKTIEIGGRQIKEEHLDIEEDIARAETKELYRQKKHETWEDEAPRGHRRGHKPPKVGRSTIREESDIEEAA